MCGIIGFINAEFNTNHYGGLLRNVFEEMLIADVARGEDGTGILAVNTIDLLPTVVKSAQWAPI